MTQTRLHDYRSPRSSADLNKKLVGILPPGVYQGFHVSSSGLLAPGVLLTAEGVRIEETESVQLTLTPNTDALPRRDLVVCTHEYQATVPAPAAAFQVVTGTPSEGIVLPDLPAFSTIIAICRMPAGGSAWDLVSQNAIAPEVLFNSVRDGWEYRIITGGEGALRIAPRLYPDSAVLECYLATGTGLADGEVISWGDPVFTFSSDGTFADIIRLVDTDGRFTGDTVEAALAELAGAGRTTQNVKANADAITAHLNSTTAHQAAHIPIADAGSVFTGTNVETALQEIAGAGRTTQTVKANADAIAVRAIKTGDTFTGAMTFQAGVTFPSAVADNVHFDADLTIERTIPACAGMRPDLTDGTTFYPIYGAWMLSRVNDMVLLPIEGVPGRKLHEVTIYFYNPNAVENNVVCTLLRRTVLGTANATSLAAVSDSLITTLPDCVTLSGGDNELSNGDSYYLVVTCGPKGGTTSDNPDTPIRLYGAAVKYKQGRVVV